MPLPDASSRTPLVARSIECSGYERADGLLEVEGRLADTRSYDHAYGWRDPVPAGSPVHEMLVRITFDASLVIREVSCATDAAPFPTCREIIPNLDRLVGLPIAGGFRKAMHARVGGTAGCTHVVTLIEALANCAVQTLASQASRRKPGGAFAAYGMRDPSRPALIDSCHSYAASSAVVRESWPEHYRPPEPST